MVGAYRTEQSWVGGTSPRDAAYVPPPPALIEELMDDLIAFANDDTLDPVTQAALVHAQFESIHPYADGNGRIGRVLIGWVLARRLDMRGAAAGERRHRPGSRGVSRRPDPLPHGSDRRLGRVDGRRAASSPARRPTR